MDNLPAVDDGVPGVDAYPRDSDDYRKMIHDGNDLWEQICRSSKATFSMWLDLGTVVLEMRRTAMLMAGTTDLKSNAYRKQFTALLDDTTFGRMDKSTRSKLLDLTENRDEVTAWFDRLPEYNQNRWFHPATVWKEYQKASGNKPKDKRSKDKGKGGKDNKGGKEHKPSTPKEVDEAFGIERPLDMVRIGRDPKANVDAIMKVVDSFGFTPEEREAFCAGMSTWFLAVVDPGEFDGSQEGEEID